MRNEIGHQGIDPVFVGFPQDPGDGPGNVIVGENARPHGIVNVMIDISDLVRLSDNLSLPRLRHILPSVTQNAQTNLMAQVQALSILL